MPTSLTRPLDRRAARELAPRVSLRSPLVWLPLVVLLAVGLVLRLLDLYRGMWEDELTIAYYTQLPVGLVLPTVAQNGAHPPLYFLIAVLDSRHLDVVPALRAPSVIAGVLTIAVMFFLVLRAAGLAAATVAAALTTFAPVAIWYSDEARMYALAWLFVLASYLWLVWGHDSPRWRIFAVLHAVSVALALWTDYSSALALVPQLVLVLLLKHRRAFFVSYVAGWLSITPWLYFLREQYGRIEAQRFPGYGDNPSSWIAVLLDLTGAHANYANITNTLPPIGVVALLVLLAGAAIATAGAAVRGRATIAAIALCLTLGALAVGLAMALQGTVAVVATRVMGIITFGVIVVFAAGVAFLVRHESRAWRTVAAACVAVLLVCMVGAGADVLRNGTNGTQWNGVASTIDKNAQPGDALIYYPVVTRYAVDPYLSPSSRWRSDFNGLWPKDDATAEAAFATWTAGKQRVWFVFYAIGGVDMPQHDAWFQQHSLCRVRGDPTQPLGLIEYEATTTGC